MPTHCVSKGCLSSAQLADCSLFDKGVLNTRRGGYCPTLVFDGPKDYFLLDYRHTAVGHQR